MPSTPSAKNIFGDPTSPIDTILAFNIPNSRAFMHLDTVFTQIDTDKFTIHPGIMGPLTVFEITAEGDGIKVKESERHAGEHPGDLRRAVPWSSSPAAAATASRPSASSGTTARTRCASLRAPIVVYERNDVTNKVLQATRASSCIDGALRRALPRPWRPALHEHAHLSARTKLFRYHRWSRATRSAWPPLPPAPPALNPVPNGEREPDSAQGAFSLYSWRRRPACALPATSCVILNNTCSNVL